MLTSPSRMLGLPHRGRRAAPAALAGLALALLGPPAPAASFPPELRFRSLETSLVTVHFHDGLEPQARQAAALAEEILRAHEARYRVRVPRVHVVLADVDDAPNGFAVPFPQPIVHIAAAAPDGTDDFGNYEDWLRLVLTHELAHVVHLEEARGLLGFGRKLFGRAPFLFPNTLTPLWMIEGLATYEETEGTAFGRGRNPDARMVLRMASLEQRFPPEDVPAVSPDRWPGGSAPYVFGEAFLRNLTRQHGRDTLPELARVHAGRVVPFVDDLTSSRVTGESFHANWRDWRARAAKEFEDEARALERRGLTVSRPLTARGIRQLGPRFSPDGAWIAYTSRTFARYPAIRLVRPDGSGDRRLADRNGGSSLSWTPDGGALVFDQPETYRLFRTWSDLWIAEVPSGRRRRLTRGLRASDPDVAPDGRSVVFVRRVGDRREVAVIGMDGSGLKDLTRSAPGTQWSGPRVSPDGRSVVAARWTAGGWLDLALVDLETGAVTELTHDRARDTDPSFTPDGTRIVFRSDRDGVSNLYALDLADRSLARVTRVLGGAFDPAPSPDGRRLAFAGYTARGYDVNVAEVDWERLPPAGSFVDGSPPPRPAPEPAGAEARPYRPLPALLPRFWSPYAASVSGEWRWGAVTAGVDPLLRHAFGLDLHRGSATGRISAQGFYLYDRLRPTLILTAEDSSEPAAAAASEAVKRTQQVEAQASFPLTRSFEKAQTLALAWRFKRESLVGDPGSALDLGGVELAWALGTAKQYPYSISPVDGWRLRLAVLQEARALGSDVSLAKALADARFYTRLLGEGDALALRLGGGTTFGRKSFTRSFAVGGFPDGSLFDVVGSNHSVLRGYPDDGCDARGRCFTGRSFAHANLEYRFPLAHPQRGVRSLPCFLRHLHAALFADAADAWTGSFALRDVKTGAGAALGADLILGHALPLTATLGAAHGFAEGGKTQVYFRLGLSF